MASSCRPGAGVVSSPVGDIAVTESGQPIDPTAYSEEYFLTGCDGHEKYLAGGEPPLPQRLQTVWKFSRVRPGMKVLDVGCGRGEMIVHYGVSGIRAIGIDFSKTALRLAQRAIAHAYNQGRDAWASPHLSLGNAKRLPFPSDTFDRAILSDIVEHLHPEELTTALTEVHRVLVPGGELLIHTMPNLWYYRYGYPLFRLVQRFRGVSLPTDPRKRSQFSHVHVNEQTPRTLHKALIQSGFPYRRVWLSDYHSYSQYDTVMRLSMRLLTSLPLVKQVFCNDIFALARK